MDIPQLSSKTISYPSGILKFEDKSVDLNEMEWPASVVEPLAQNVKTFDFVSIATRTNVTAFKAVMASCDTYLDAHLQNDPTRRKVIRDASRHKSLSMITFANIARRSILASIEANDADIVKCVRKLCSMATLTEEPTLVSQARITQASVQNPNPKSIHALKISLVTSMFNAPILKFKGTTDEFTNSTETDSLHSILVDEHAKSQFTDYFAAELINIKRQLNRMPLIACGTTVGSMYRNVTSGQKEIKYTGIMSTNLLAKSTLDLVALFNTSKFPHMVAQAYNQLMYHLTRDLIYELYFNLVHECTRQTIMVVDGVITEKVAIETILPYHEKHATFLELNSLFASNMELTPEYSLETAEYPKNLLEDNGTELMGSLQNGGTQAMDIISKMPGLSNLTDFVKGNDYTKLLSLIGK